MSIKFDFASIWPSMDEYIEYFFSRKMQSWIIHMHAANTVNQQNQG